MTIKLGDNRMYDYIIVGSGLFGSIFAHEMTSRGQKCLVVERRDHIGGNCYTYEEKGIQVHRYGAHIFRTSDKRIWEYINRFAEFNNFINTPIANYNGEIYNMPFNMNTFSRMWSIATPEEAEKIISKQRMEIKGEPRNLEEKVISLVGRDVYEKLVKGYTEKQWGRPCHELPESIIRRLPVRMTYNNNYFSDRYQGIPEGGYTAIMETMLSGSDVILGKDFIKNRYELSSKARRIIYTGPIDEYYDYCFGQLEYRALRFETECLDMKNYQGVAVVNYTDAETPYTRIIEHKHFEFGEQPVTIITREYPFEWTPDVEPYYPINDDKNQKLYEKYAALASEEKDIVFAGRLGSYSYTDMQDTIKAALSLVEKEAGN